MLPSGVFLDKNRSFYFHVLGVIAVLYAFNI